MANHKLAHLTDRELVKGLLSNNPDIIEYFFFEKCSRMFVYIINSVFGGRIEKEELLNELFLYLVADDWKKVRSFDFNSSLLTWVTIVAIRFFIRKRDQLIGSGTWTPLLYDYVRDFKDYIKVDSINLSMAIDKMPNERYRIVIKMIDLEDLTYEDTAKHLNVTVSNLYNIHRRALAQLRYILLT